MTETGQDNGLRRLVALGQSVWYDNIHRNLLPHGLQELIQHDGLSGVTSNPAIFQKAIGEGEAYDAGIREALATGADGAEAIFEALAVADIRAAADVLKPVHDAADGADGFVSIEVSPELAYRTEETIEAARRLHRWIDRPNVMVKVPGTEPGLPAIETLIAEGVPVNVTLLFGLERYEAVAEAYCRGLEARHEQGLSLVVPSVASFFVSRLDSKLDPVIDGHGDPKVAARLRSRAGITNARCAYGRYRQRFHGERFAALRAAGAKPQRLLWASTGVKDPSLPPTWYAHALAGPETVNTLPPAAWEACRASDPGDEAPLARLDREVEDRRWKELDELVDGGLARVTAELEEEGVDAFADAYTGLLHALEKKSARLGSH